MKYHRPHNPPAMRNNPNFQILLYAHVVHVFIRLSFHHSNLIALIGLIREISIVGTININTEINNTPAFSNTI